MIIQADVRGLELVGTAFNSKDPVLYKELNDELDIHSDNQVKFKLPERVIAKIFVFKLLYGAMAFGFANDPDFSHISSSDKYWQKVIDRYYDKYQGVYNWHNQILSSVGSTSRLDMCTGRSYKWDLQQTGAFKLPATQIKNYPTQGLGADIMAVARVSFYRRWLAGGFTGRVVNTVHDSIVVDVPRHEQFRVCELFHGVFNDLPDNINKIFGIGFDLKTHVEVLAGQNMYDMQELKLA